MSHSPGARLSNSWQTQVADTSRGWLTPMGLAESAEAARATALKSGRQSGDGRTKGPGTVQ